MWVGLLWAGWVFLFASGEPSSLDTRAQEPVTWFGYIYCVAYTMFTMGNGDFTPVVGSWQVATRMMTGSGMVLVTLVVTYILSVLQAVNKNGRSPKE